MRNPTKVRHAPKNVSGDETEFGPNSVGAQACIKFVESFTFIDVAVLPQTRRVSLTPTLSCDSCGCDSSELDADACEKGDFHSEADYWVCCYIDYCFALNATYNFREDFLC